MDLTELELVYLPDATPVPQEVISDFAGWQSRSAQERGQIIRLVHDHVVGEEWDNQDSWQDVHFTKTEIDAFSKHILVGGDSGLPEWLGQSKQADGRPADKSTIGSGMGLQHTAGQEMWIELKYKKENNLSYDTKTK